MANILKATFDTTTQSGQFKVFNAQGSASNALKDVEANEVLTVTDIVVYEDTIDSYGSDTTGKVTVLFTVDDNGEVKLYGSVSSPVSESAEKLVDLMAGLSLDEVKVQVSKGLSKSGREFLTLKTVM